MSDVINSLVRARRLARGWAKKLEELAETFRPSPKLRDADLRRQLEADCAGRLRMAGDFRALADAATQAIANLRRAGRKAGETCPLCGTEIAEASIPAKRGRQAGVTRIAAALGVTKGHVSRCLRGERFSGRVARAAGRRAS